MFSNFKNSFISKPQFTSEIPAAVIDTIGKNLPNGFFYKDIGGGICRLACDGRMDVTIERIELPDDVKKMFEQSPQDTITKLKIYSYNSQRPIKILPDENGDYTVNGTKINNESFVAAPLKNIKFEEGFLYLLPQEFPQEFEIQVSGNGYELPITMRRSPIESLTQLKFSNTKEAPLNISYIVNEDLKGGQMHLSISIGTPTNAEDALASREIYNAFMSGTGKICGAELKIPADTGKLVPQEVIDLWKQIVEIERVFQVSFDVSKQLLIEDIDLIRKLYRSLVEKKPYRVNLENCVLNGNADFYKNSSEKNPEVMGKEILFEYTEGIESLILGVELQYYCLCDVFGGIIKDYKDEQTSENGKFGIRIIPATGKTLYSSSQYYLDMKEIEETIESRAHVETFKNAELI